MNVRKWHHSEICIAINDESKGIIANNLRCDELLYYTFITHSAGKRIFKIGEHLGKLWAKFAMHFCPQRCRSRQISWITCVLHRLLLSLAVLTGRLMWVNYQELSNCSRPALTYWLTVMPSVTDWLLIMYGCLPRQLFFVAAVVYSGLWNFFIWPM